MLLAADLHGRHVAGGGIAREVQALEAAAQLAQPAQRRRPVCQRILAQPEVLQGVYTTTICTTS